MSLLGLSNILLFQWFFVRLAKSADEYGRIHYGFIFWVAPCSGWWSDYVTVGEKYKFRVFI